MSPQNIMCGHNIAFKLQNPNRRGIGTIFLPCQLLLISRERGKQNNKRFFRLDPKHNDTYVSQPLIIFSICLYHSVAHAPFALPTLVNLTGEGKGPVHDPGFFLLPSHGKWNKQICVHIPTMHDKINAWSLIVSLRCFSLPFISTGSFCLANIG